MTHREQKQNSLMHSAAHVEATQKGGRERKAVQHLSLYNDFVCVTKWNKVRNAIKNNKRVRKKRFVVSSSRRSESNKGNRGNLKT
jgi:hypothetical protein